METTSTVAAPAPLLNELIAALLPLQPELDPARREQVRGDVVAFVAAQIGGLPVFLRWPYRLAMVGFDYLALRPYGRRFVRLDMVRRRDYLSMWIHSGIGVKRDFIKLIRSCALLAFYDHPLVMERMLKGGPA